MLWIGLLIIVGLLLIAALIGADVPPPTSSNLLTSQTRGTGRKECQAAKTS